MCDTPAGPSSSSRSTSSQLGCALYLVYTLLCSRVYVETLLAALLPLRTRSLSAAAAFVHSFCPFVAARKTRRSDLQELHSAGPRCCSFALVPMRRCSVTSGIRADRDRSRGTSRIAVSGEWFLHRGKISLFRDKFIADG